MLQREAASSVCLSFPISFPQAAKPLPANPLRLTSASESEACKIVSGSFRRLLLRAGLQHVEIVGGALRMGGGCEDRPLVVFQNLEPVANV